MQIRVAALAGIVLLVGFAALASSARAAGEGEVGPEGKVTTLVGDLAHVDPQSQTVVVEVPVADQLLTVGAWSVAGTTLTSGGQAIDFGDLEPGLKVRITFRRVTHGDELVSLEVLRAPSG
ncbi:MAG: hypothetical protein ACE147_07625 [Candidatus Methylomirabilales bacterium]